MRAIVIKEYGPVEDLVYQELPEPEAEAGHVVIEIKAFGLNHAEMHMRRGEFKVRQKVASLMGGLGRTINGSYAEYTKARVENVVSIESNLPWEVLAAIPEAQMSALPECKSPAPLVNDQ